MFYIVFLSILMNVAQIKGFILMQEKFQAFPVWIGGCSRWEKYFLFPILNRLRERGVIH